MGHHHHHSTKNIKIAFFLNLSFTIFELIGGYWTNSVAILSDAVHDLGDSFSLGLSWYLQKKSKQQGDSKYSFGYQRFSLLGALLNGMILFAGSLFIMVETIPRLLHPEPCNAKGMLLIAIFGILVNGAAVFQMKDGKSMNEKVVSLHLLEDVLGWVAVLIVSIVLIFKDIPILDPILSILILGYVMFGAFRNLGETFTIFMQGVPEDVDVKAIEAQVLSVPCVRSAHHTNIWSLEGETNVLTMHVVIGVAESYAEVLMTKQAVQKILRTFPIKHATIEIEVEGESCFISDGYDEPDRHEH